MSKHDSRRRQSASRPRSSSVRAFDQSKVDGTRDGGNSRGRQTYASGPNNAAPENSRRKRIGDPPYLTDFRSSS